jgi:hypothetical protein
MENTTPEITQEATQTPVVEQDVIIDTVVDTNDIDSGLADQATPEAPEAQPEVPSVEVSDEPIVLENLTFNDALINIQIPPDAAKLAAEKGFDIKDLTSELFSSEDLSFSQETYDKLVDAYGKFFVDMTIQSVKSSATLGVKEAKEAYAVAEKEAFDNISGIVGGEEGWSKLEEFASSLEAEEVSRFNEAMQSGNPLLQRYAVEALMAKMPKEDEAPQPLRVVDGKINTGGGSSGYMTAAEYQAAIISGEYKKNPAHYDTLRRNGINKGI